MDLKLLLEMVVSSFGERIAVEIAGQELTYAELDRKTSGASALVRDHQADGVVYVAPNDLAFPIALFGAVRSGVPFVPLNYRLGAEQLGKLLLRHERALLVRGSHLSSGAGVAAWDPESFLRAASARAAVSPGCGSSAPEDLDEGIALCLYTSGTTASPKAALLRHRHLASYVFATVEFGGASEEEAALVAMPPYHIAGVANLLTNLYAGRRIVYLDSFDPREWLDTARRAGITQAMVVPTMLARIVAALKGRTAQLPKLRTLSYGGARMPLPVIEEAMKCFPGVGFVNAYGLTETSSTIAVLGPADHAAALHAREDKVRARLASVGRPLPGVEVEVRDEGSSKPAATGESGVIFLRGDQVSGEYEHARLLDEEGWFATGDRGRIDEDGYLFIEGRVDDVIIRGGENIAPAEVEDVLMRHPAVVDAAVVGLPDDEWGEAIAAAVVADEGAEVDAASLRAWVRAHLRSSKTPDVVGFWDELPRTPTGKLVRRDLMDDLAALRLRNGEES